MEVDLGRRVGIVELLGLGPALYVDASDRNAPLFIQSYIFVYQWQKFRVGRGGGCQFFQRVPCRARKTRSIRDTARMRRAEKRGEEGALCHAEAGEKRSNRG